METTRVNEETEDGNYVVEIFNTSSDSWEYITTEFSAPVAVCIMSNLFNATKQKCRILSRRSDNMILAKVG